MPGSSLWLIPPRNSPVYSIVQTLIDKGIPSLFPSINPPTFPPHVTLTSSIPSSVYTTSSPQAWLDSLQLPTGDEIDVRIIGLDVGNVWNKAITLIVSKGSEEGNDGASHGQMTALMRLAVECRERGVESNASGQVGDKGKVRAKKWVAEDWEPHMSLL
ncbi:CPDase-domain-containing protein [Patellaria atrata CBS 101060]|uniref:CPDase-domain-containing protein n=1 Tax=Patellaria atrata CBS 101060 TaxID=1346257 RepID=A0A9P4SG81_9PEZI|nr:CPDase-domain-containing protein [Patellaria atrata CBS 101060]